MDLTDVNTIKSLLKQENIWPDKRLGQNFLVDHNVLTKIVDVARIDINDMVVEIGPGLGTLTQELAKRAGLVLTIEKDRKLVEWLRRYFKSQSDKVKIVCDDILQYDLSKLIKGSHPERSEGSNNDEILHLANRRIQNDNNIKSDSNSSDESRVTSDGQYKVISNLPYNITSPVIRKFVEANPTSSRLRGASYPPSEMVLMVQKEVAQRICAKPGNRERGLLTVLIEYFGKAEIIEIVPRTCFYPEPDVDSAIIRIKDKGLRSKGIDYKTFLSTTKIGFSQKRRQIHHPLKSGLHLSKDEVYDILKKASINPVLRAEDISLEEWIELGKHITKKIESS